MTLEVQKVYTIHIFSDDQPSGNKMAIDAYTLHTHSLTHATGIPIRYTFVRADTRNFGTSSEIGLRVLVDG